MEFRNEKIDAIIREARERKASDIHISQGMPIWYRAWAACSGGNADERAGDGADA